MSPAEIFLFALPLLWIAGVVLASARFRSARGKPIFPAVPDNALYAERWGSGRNLSAFPGKLGGANNCLIIAVTPDSLMVVPRFPFTLMFLPETFGLEFTCPLKTLRSIERKRSFLRELVVIELEDGRRFELQPRRIDDFMAAIRRP